MIQCVGRASLGGGSAFIKSVQEITGQVSSGNLSLNVSISSIVVANSFLLFTRRGADSPINSEAVTAQISSSTNVIIQRSESSGNGAATVIQVVELADGIVKSRQAGSITITPSDFNVGLATITAVDTSKYMLLSGGSRVTDASPRASRCALALASATSISARRADVFGTLILQYEILDFN